MTPETIFKSIIIGIIFIVVFASYVMAAGKSINNLEEDDDGVFYDRRTKKK